MTQKNGSTTLSDVLLISTPRGENDTPVPRQTTAGDIAESAPGCAETSPNGPETVGILQVGPFARSYTFRAHVFCIREDVTYLRDPAGRVTLLVPWDGERIGDERTVTVEVRP